MSKMIGLRKFAATAILIIVTIFVTAIITTDEVSAHDNVTLTDGQEYNLSSVTKATNLYIKNGGTYTIKGGSNRVMMYIEIKSGQTANIYLDGITLNPDGNAPGASIAKRSAIIVEESDKNSGTINLISKPGTISRIHSYQGRPAIRKDSTKSKLRFLTEDENNPGTIVAIADPDAYRTCAIGSYGNITGLFSNGTTGNMEFRSGIIEAYGSKPYTDLFGGAGIGGGNFDSVDGLLFSGATVKATSGSSKAAAIGTGSAYAAAYAWAIRGIHCDNVTITAGRVEAICGKDESTMGGGAAAIGGGDAGSAHNINIKGNPTVIAKGASFGTGIGGGADGNGENIVIEGGNVEATGGATGIGGGYSTSELDPYEPIDSLQDSQEDSITKAAETVYGNGIVRISGGKVIAKAVGPSDGVGIGGWKADGTSSVNISGGQVEAYGFSNGSGIGSGYLGKMTSISISGGHIKAYGGEYGPGIGTHVYKCIASSESSVGSINISGGTIYAQGGEGKNAAAEVTSDKKLGLYGYVTGVDIGGYSYTHALLTKIQYTPVYISGGNVKTAHWKTVKDYNKRGIFCGTQQQSRNGSAVSLHRSIMDTLDASENSTQAMVASLENSTGSQYGTKDTRLIPETISEGGTTAGVLYSWLPATESTAAVNFDQDMTKRSFHEDKTMYGKSVAMSMTDESDKTTESFYPATLLNLKANAPDVESESSKDGVAYAHYKNSGIFELENAERTGHHVSKYTKTEESGSTTVIDANGKLQNSVAGMTNDDGNWIKKSVLETVLYGENIFAQWEPNTNSVAFDKNLPNNASTIEKASGVMENQEGFIYGQETRLKTNSYKLPGYNFEGWNTKADGTGKAYAEQAAVKDLDGGNGSAVTLYAQWSPKTYSVSFESGGGEGTMDSQIMKFDESKALSKNTFTYSGYNFWGWQQGQGLGKIYEDEAVVTNLCGTPDSDGNIRNVTMTASWVESGSIVVAVYNNNQPLEGIAGSIKIKNTIGGQETTGFQYDKGKKVYILKSSGNEAGNYTVSIDGYNTDDRIITVDESHNGSIVLNYYTVEIAGENDQEHCSPYIVDPYSSQKIYPSGSTAGKVDKILAGSSLKINTEVNKGYIFESYTALGDSPLWEDTDPTKASQSITVNGEVLIEAHPVPVKYQVKYDANEESYPQAHSHKGSMKTQDMIYDEPQALFENQFELIGYEFKGWSTEKEPGSGDKVYTDKENLKNMSSQEGDTVMLYAQWERKAADQQIKGKVRLQGRDMVDGEKYTFIISAADQKTMAAISSEAVYMPEDIEVNTTSMSKDGSYIDFAFKDIIFNKAGDYSFIISQQDPSLPGIIIDSEDKPVNVEVTESGGKFHAEIKSADAKFDNNYYASLPANLDGIVGLEGKSDDKSKTLLLEIEKGRFTFNAENINGKSGVLTADGISEMCEKNNKSRVRFTPLNLATLDAQDSNTLSALVDNGSATKSYENGKETYSIDMMISQTSSDGKGVTVDNRTIPITLRVIIDPNSSTLRQEIVADDPVEYNNVYETNNAVIKVTAEKVMKGDRKIAEGEFRSTISGNGPMSDNLTVANDADGIFDFGTITYRLTDLDGDNEKTFKYMIKEEPSNIKGVKDDLETKTFNVVVTDHGDGELTVKANGNDGIKIINVYDPNDGGTVTGDRTVIAIFIVIMIISACALICVFRIRRA